MTGAESVGDQAQSSLTTNDAEVPASMTSTVESIVERLAATNAVRDSALTQGRRVIRLSANAVRALHRGEATEAESLLAEARELLQSTRESTAAFPNVYWAGYVQDAMKEYAEAEITRAALAGRALPDPTSIQVEDAAYLNGLAEAASELRRDVLDLLRSDDIKRAERLLATMDGIYAELVTVDFAEAVTGGLRRSTDQLRGVLERTRGDVTLATRQHRLEQALLRAEERLTLDR